MSSSHNHYHWNFSYDNLNRLLSANYGYGSGSGSSWFDVTGLQYDKSGNITGLQRDDETGSLVDNLTYSYAGSNRLQSVSDGVSTTSEPWDAEDATFGYDPSGNLTSQSGKLTDVAYEHRNLPVHFYLDGGNELIANYNADGQRILKELAGGSWQFYVKDGQQTLAVIKDGNLSHINLVGNSTFGRWEPGGTRRFYITDHLGSTRAVVDDQGTVLETFDYYPFGLLMPKRNTASANTTEKFSGKELDENTNQYYFGARYLDPALGRFFVPDRFAEKYPDMTPYQYAANNPVLIVDINGDSLEVSGSNQSIQQLVGLINQGLGGFHTASVNDEGLLTLESTGKEGQMTKEQKAFYDVISQTASLETGLSSFEIVNHSDALSSNIFFGDNGEAVVSATPGRHTIDIGDASALGQDGILTPKE